MSLPYDIIGTIINQADVAIDTMLAFRKLGAVPKKLVVDEGFQSSVSAILQRRAAFYHKYKSIQDDFKWVSCINLDSFVKHATDHTTVELTIEDYDGELNMVWKTVHFDGHNMWRIRTSTYCIHTGKEAEFA
jgi:hypothetical protein